MTVKGFIKSNFVLFVVVLFSLGILLLYPLGALLYYSIFQEGTSVFGAYTYILRADVLSTMSNTLTVAFFSTLFGVLMGVPMAWATTRVDLPLKGLFHTLVSVSLTSPPLVLAVAYIYFLRPNVSLINHWLEKFFPGSFSLSVYSMPVLIFAISIYVFIYVYMVTSASLRSMDHTLEESSRMCGANLNQTTLRITFPMILPGIISGAILAFATSMMLLITPVLIGVPGGIHVAASKIFIMFTQYPPDFAMATTLSVLFMVISLFLLYVQRRILSKGSFVTVTGKQTSKLSTIKLGRISGSLLFVYCLFIIFIATLLPFGILVKMSLTSPTNTLTLGNFLYVINNASAVRGLGNSLILAFLTASLITILGAAIGMMVTRNKQLPICKAIHYLSILPLGVPSFVLAVGIIWAWLHTPIYATLWILLLAYLGQSIPLSVQNITGGIEQIDFSLEEASRMSGASWWTTFRKVTIPLLSDVLISSWTMVFMRMLKEGGSSLFLYSAGTQTLMVVLFEMYRDSPPGYVAAFATLVLLINLCGLTILQKMVGRRRNGAKISAQN